MPFLADIVFDGGLNQLNGLTENLYITSAEATTFAEASTTFRLGTKATPTIGTGVDRSGGGREVVVSAITDGTVNTTGSASLRAHRQQRLAAAGYRLAVGSAKRDGLEHLYAGFVRHWHPGPGLSNGGHC